VNPVDIAPNASATLKQDVSLGVYMSEEFIELALEGAEVLLAGASSSSGRKGGGCRKPALIMLALFAAGIAVWYFI